MAQFSTAIVNDKRRIWEKMGVRVGRGVSGGVDPQREEGRP